MLLKGELIIAWLAFEDHGDGGLVLLAEVVVPEEDTKLEHPVLAAEGGHVPQSHPTDVLRQVFRVVLQPVELILNAGQELSVFKFLEMQAPFNQRGRPPKGKGSVSLVFCFKF